jgi:glycosyltransferase involved in cell wall biosynthesis
MAYKILHVAAHYGGGVGSIIRSWINHDSLNSHTLTYLNDISDNDKPGQYLFNPEMIEENDIILCHVWNHPSMFEFLINSDIPPCRLIGWSHMSGLYPPYVLFDRLVYYFDEFLYTSPVSNLTGIRRDYIWSCCDIYDFLNIVIIPHNGFNVGYIGTLDYCKIHPDFIDICSRIDIPDVKFIIVGSGGDADSMRDEVTRRGLDDKFTFTGLVDDVKPILATFDVFLYPLYERHFGTCEQVLGEAMAVGLPCVVLDNMAEEFIIDHGVNGIICQGVDEIPSVIMDIYNHNIRIDSNVVRKSAARLYSVNNKVAMWSVVFDRIMQQDKRGHKWYNVFIESLGEQGDIIRRCLNYGDIDKIKDIFNDSLQWSSNSKGSVRQYADYYKNDSFFKELIELI